MKKIVILSLLSVLIMLFVSPVIALNKNGKKTLTVNVYGQYIETTESEMYQVVYDMKYKSFMNLMANRFDEVGVDPSYFMDDIKKENQCYADAFAKALSVSDFEILMSYESSDALRNGIIDNIAKKEIDKCRDKYMKYFNDLQDFLYEYATRKCGKIDNKKRDEAEIDKYIKCFAETMAGITNKIEIKDKK